MTLVVGGTLGAYRMRHHRLDIVRGRSPRPNFGHPLERRKFAEDSFYACLLNGNAQGLPFKQIHQPERGWLLDRKIGGLGALQQLVDGMTG